VRVGICINTFRRHEQLATLLAAIGRLRFSRVERPDVDVVVVNNDVETGVGEVLEAARATLWFPLHGLDEPQRGIPQARNRGVRHAFALGADCVALLDDDEWPEPDWLDHLLDGARQTGADLIQGRVVPEFLHPPPAWALAWATFDVGRDESSMTTGQSLGHASTNNLLIRREVFERVGFFDEWWETQGGDDTEFTLRAARYGLRIAWWPAAIAHEWIPRTRTTLRWVLRRAFRSGNTYGLICRRLSGTGQSHAFLLAVALIEVMFAAFRFPWPLIGGRSAAIRTLRTLCYALGNLGGVLQFKYREHLHPNVGRDYAATTAANAEAGDSGATEVSRDVARS
jgi:GT2 family glycosyltransferase